jgi:hypothetical protein
MLRKIGVVVLCPDTNLIANTGDVYTKFNVRKHCDRVNINMEEQLDYSSSADPPTGLYWCISTDANFLQWVNEIRFMTCRYCPGTACTHGGPSTEMEALRIFLCHIQCSQGWDGSFVVNPMHVGLNVVDEPKHLLIICPFMDAEMDMGQ